MPIRSGLRSQTPKLQEILSTRSSETVNDRPLPKAEATPKCSTGAGVDCPFMAG